MEQGIWVLMFCIWVFNLSYINGDTNPSDVSALNVLYTSLNSDGQLTGWSSSGGDPCGQSWTGITCSGSSITSIKLSGMGLSGNLGYQLNSMNSLLELDMSGNNVGSSITYNIPTTLQKLNLAGNSFNGSIPYLISQMNSLQYLNLARNQLDNNLNVDFGHLTNLTTLNLSFNSITGNLPDSMKSLSNLTTLHLQNNQLSGPIDVLANLPLQDLNVANNRFTGWIPDQLKNINNLQTGGNSWSSGSAPSPPPYTPPPTGPSVNPNIPSNGGGGGKSSGIGGGGIAGIVISVLVISVIIAFFLVRKKTRRSRDTSDPDQSFTPLNSTEAKVEMRTIHTSSAVNTIVLQPSATFNLRPPPSDRHKDNFSNKPILAKKFDKDPMRATVYSVAELQEATNSFSIDHIVGEGSIGRVYKTQFTDGKVLAVKKISFSALPTQSTDDFTEIVSNISRLHHPNLTELVGYCSEHGQHLLVYGYQKNGSLHDLLHISDDYSEALTWNARVKIALGTARALEYLHEVCSPYVVHKNFKSRNILLDTELNPHLSDSGLANLIPNAEYQVLDHNMSSGYAAPEVAMSGQYTMKSDVYCFGVVMLELLTGRMPFDGSRPRSEHLLVRWATPQLHDIDALDKMVDPMLKGLYPAKSLSRFADVIALCVQSEPEFRPPMSEVVEALVRLVQRANMSKRMVGGDAQDYMF